MGGPLRNDFRTIHFTKTGEEIIKASGKRREGLIQRVRDRQAAISAHLVKHELTTLEVMALMSKEQDFAVLSNAYVGSLRSTSGAQLVAAKNEFKASDWDTIHGEHTRMMEEMEEIANMNLVIKHLKPDDVFKLTKHDIEYYEL